MERNSKHPPTSLMGSEIAIPVGDNIPQLKKAIEDLKSDAVPSYAVPVDRIIPLQLPENMKQPRLYFDPRKMELLQDSIHKYGVLEPILLRPSQGSFFEVVSGERRWRCCQTLALKTIPGIVRDMSDTVALEAAIIAHLLSEDISLIEQTESILGLLALRLCLSFEDLKVSLYKVKNSQARGAVNPGVFSDQQYKVIQEILGEFGLKLSSFVSNRLPLLKLAPSILASVRAGELSPTNAILINRQPPEYHDSLISQAQGKTKSEVRALIRAIGYSAPPSIAKNCISEQIFERIKSFHKKKPLFDQPEIIDRLMKIDLLLGEIEALAQQIKQH